MMTVAQTILSQLGGNKFIAMTGSCDFVGLTDGLQFKVGTGAKDGINKVRIILTADDDYTVEFWKIRGTKINKLQTFDHVYVDNLQDVFSRRTGLYTRLVGA